MSKNGSAGNRGRLEPAVLFCVVHLDVMDGSVVGPSADKVDVAVIAYAGDGIIYPHRNIVAAQPAISQGFIDIQIGNGSFPALRVHHIATKQEDVFPGADRRGRDSSNRTGDRTRLGPLP